MPLCAVFFLLVLAPSVIRFLKPPLLNAGMLPNETQGARMTHILRNYLQSRGSFFLPIAPAD